MVTEEEYEKWMRNVRRNDYRILLIEADYADKEVIQGHGRSNFADTLNEIIGMKVNVYNGNFTELQFVQPTSQEGYSWEVWIGGDIVRTTQSGDYSFTAVEDQLYQISVASVMGSRYSKPWIVEFVPKGVPAEHYGAVGDWQDVGAGAGTEGTGKLYFASSPWVSDQGIVYDDFISTEPEIEQSLDDFEGVGDFRALNLTNEINWRDLYWRGHNCLWFHGDRDWLRDDFRPIAAPMIEDCRRVDSKEFQFDLMDGGQQFKRRFALSEVELTSNVYSTLEYVSENAGLPSFSYINISNARRNYSTYMVLDEESQIDDVVRTIADSIRAYVRINLAGGIDVFLPETVVTGKISEDDIVNNTVRMVDSKPAVKRIVLEMAQGNSVKATTPASTGKLVETITIKTVLNNFDHANIILGEYVAYYAVPHSVWELGVINTGLIEVGQKITVDHEDVSGVGLVTRVKRRPLSPYSTVEVEI